MVVKKELKKLTGKSEPKAAKVADDTKKAKKESAVLTVPPAKKPDDLKLTAEETAQVEAVAVEVREAYVKGGVETLRFIGKIVLDALYDGSFENFKNRGTDHKSFRALAFLLQDGLGSVSASNLWYAMVFQESVEMFGAENADRIPGSHQRVLVHVKDPEVRKELAQRTVNEGLTVNALRALVPPKDPTKTGGPGAGRPKLKPEVKALHLLKTVATEKLPGIASVWTDDDKDVAEKATLRQDVAQVREKVIAWLDALDAQLGTVVTVELVGE